MNAASTGSGSRLESVWASCRGIRIGAATGGRPAKSHSRLGVLAAFVCASALTGFSQEALYNAVRNDREVSNRRRQSAASFSEVEGVEAGPVRFSLGASYSLQFNDNVGNTQNNPQSDFIQTPGVSLDVSAPLSEQSQLSFQFGVGYRDYWHHDNLSRLIITADSGTGLAFDLQVKDVFITLYDNVSVESSIADAAEVANQSQVPRLNNTIGARATWVPDKILVSAGYGYQIVLALDNAYDYVNRASHLIFVRGGYVFAGGAATVGPECTATLTDYENNLTSDSGVVSFGPYLDWQISDAITTSLRGGFLYYANSLTILPEDTFDANNYYVDWSIRQQLTENLSHGLNVSRGVRQSLQQGTTFNQQTGFNYRFSWRFIDPVSLGANVGYVHGQSFAAAGVAASETYDQWRLGVDVTYTLLERISCGLRYAYIDRGSNLPNRDYVVNTVTLSLGYRFK